MRQSACLEIDPITLDNFAALFNCTLVDRTSDSPDLKLFILIGWDRSSFVCCLVHRDSPNNHLLLQISGGVVWQIRAMYLSGNTFYLLSPRLCFLIVFKRDLFVNRDDSLTS